jgi:hypothetical protein
MAGRVGTIMLLVVYVGVQSTCFTESLAANLEDLVLTNQALRGRIAKTSAITELACVFVRETEPRMYGVHVLVDLCALSRTAVGALRVR